MTFRLNIELLEGERPVGDAIEAIVRLGGSETVGAAGDFDFLSAR